MVLNTIGQGNTGRMGEVQAPSPGYQRQDNGVMVG